MTAEQMDAGADTTPAGDEGRVLYPRKLRGRPVMAFASVTREQFEIRSEVGAVHIPTGADFRAYPYSNPDDMLQSLKVTWGRAGVPSTAADAEQVRRMASQLLTEQAHRVATAAPVRTLEEMGCNLRRHPPRNRRHRCEQGQFSLRVHDRLVGDGGDARRHQVRRLLGISIEVQISENELTAP